MLAINNFLKENSNFLNDWKHSISLYNKNQIRNVTCKRLQLWRSPDLELQVKISPCQVSPYSSRGNYKEFWILALNVSEWLACTPNYFTSEEIYFVVPIWNDIGWIPESVWEILCPHQELNSCHPDHNQLFYRRSGPVWIFCKWNKEEVTKTLLIIFKNMS
jgi:hypothetical protein